MFLNNYDLNNDAIHVSNLALSWIFTILLLGNSSLEWQRTFLLPLLQCWQNYVTVKGSLCKPAFPSYSSVICISSCFCWFFRQIKDIFAKWNISLIKYKIWIVKFEKYRVFLSYSVLIPLALLIISFFILP